MSIRELLNKEILNKEIITSVDKVITQSDFVELSEKVDTLMLQLDKVVTFLEGQGDFNRLTTNNFTNAEEKFEQLFRAIKLLQEQGDDL